MSTFPKYFVVLANQFFLVEILCEVFGTHTHMKNIITSFAFIPERTLFSFAVFHYFMQNVLPL
jgi:hypothetical protein